MQYHIYALAFPIDLRCESVTYTFVYGVYLYVCTYVLRIYICNTYVCTINREIFEYENIHVLNVHVNYVIFKGAP